MKIKRVKFDLLSEGNTLTGVQVATTDGRIFEGKMDYNSEGQGYLFQFESDNGFGITNEEELSLMDYVHDSFEEKVAGYPLAFSK
ncbi:MAG: hypothetical protein V1913_15765 [Fibrobacterota bacterium]